MTGPHPFFSIADKVLNEYLS